MSNYYVTASLQVGPAMSKAQLAALEAAILACHGISVFEDLEIDHGGKLRFQLYANGPGHGIWPDWLDKLKALLDGVAAGPGSIAAFNQDVSAAEEDACKTVAYCGRPGTHDAALAEMDDVLGDRYDPLARLIGDQAFEELLANTRAAILAKPICPDVGLPPERSSELCIARPRS